MGKKARKKEEEWCEVEISQDTYEMAEGLAKRLGQPVDQVVVEAVNDFLAERKAKVVSGA